MRATLLPIQPRLALLGENVLSRFKLPINRLLRHLTRRKAAWGWLLSVAGVLIYATYPPSWWAADAITQFSLIVASVAFGAVFLPEISSDLWNISKDDVEKLIPEARSSDLLEQILRAKIPEEEFADLVLDCAVLPLIRAANEPHLIVGDLVYTASIHLDEDITVDEQVVKIHRVETTLRGRRVLPPADKHDVYWVSMARSVDHLQREFSESSCLFREVVDFDDNLSDDVWLETVKRYSRARIVLDGTTIEATTDPPPGDAYAPIETQGLLRFYFDASQVIAASDHGRRTITLSLDYPLRANRLVVLLGAYYTMGSAQLTVRVYNGVNPVKIYWDAFVARALGVPSVDVQYVPKDGLCTELTVITSDNTLLWPGTGLSVWWARDDPAIDPGRQVPDVTAASTEAGIAIAASPGG